MGCRTPRTVTEQVRHGVPLASGLCAQLKPTLAARYRPVRAQLWPPQATFDAEWQPTACGLRQCATLTRRWRRRSCTVHQTRDCRCSPDTSCSQTQSVYASRAAGTRPVARSPWPTSFSGSMDPARFSFVWLPRHVFHALPKYCTPRRTAYPRTVQYSTVPRRVPSVAGRGRAHDPRTPADPPCRRRAI